MTTGFRVIGAIAGLAFVVAIIGAVLAMFLAFSMVAAASAAFV